MPDQQKQAPILPRLKTVLGQGKELIAKSTLSVGASRVWIRRARVVLGQIYGENTAEVEFWCPRWNTDSVQMSPQNMIAIRLPQLERLARIIAPAHDAAKVFIGHGRSDEWLKLHIFFSHTLALACDEFNIEPMAGLQTASRIESMLVSARMAFLVMTAEDQHKDGTFHARENVIHEVGLFQATLGSQRAIVLLENGCNRFSNLDGLTTIDFPVGDIMARSEEIRGVLRRERLL